MSPQRWQLYLSTKAQAAVSLVRKIHPELDGIEMEDLASEYMNIPHAKWPKTLAEEEMILRHYRGVWAENRRTEHNKLPTAWDHLQKDFL